MTLLLLVFDPSTGTTGKQLYILKNIYIEGIFYSYIFYMPYLTTTKSLTQSCITASLYSQFNHARLNALENKKK